MRLDRFFSLDHPVSRFALNTLIASLAGLVPLLALYVVLTPGFSEILLERGPALSRFLRQVMTNGLPVVFLVNYVAFFLYASLNSPGGRGPTPGTVLLTDISVRLIVFVLLHALIYVMSAEWFGSFGGSRVTALRVVAPTLARSAVFENISGVYLYATLVSALPLYASAVERALVLRGLQNRLPVRPTAIALALALFGLLVLALTAAASLVAEIQAFR